MKAKTKTKFSRRKPRQRRSRETVEAILEAVPRILRRRNFTNLTTNHIAVVAGVSIGSVYQYFPDKRAIFVALHGRHIEEIDRRIQRALFAHASSPLADLLRAIIDTMIDAHVGDPKVFDLLSTEVPHRADRTKHFAVRLHGTFRLAIAARAHELKKGRNLDKQAFVVAHMMESLCHGALFRRPPGMSLHDAKAEIVRAIMGYLQA
jgi:AcrR family transcriptional regulator